MHAQANSDLLPPCDMLCIRVHVRTWLMCTTGHLQFVILSPCFPLLSSLPLPLPIRMKRPPLELTKQIYCTALTSNSHLYLPSLGPKQRSSPPVGPRLQSSHCSKPNHRPSAANRNLSLSTTPLPPNPCSRSSSRSIRVRTNTPGTTRTLRAMCRVSG